MKKNQGKVNSVVVLAVVVFAAIAGMWFFSQKKGTSNNTPNNTVEQTQGNQTQKNNDIYNGPPVNIPPASSTSTTKKFQGNGFSFNYDANASVTEQTGIGGNLYVVAKTPNSSTRDGVYLVPSTSTNLNDLCKQPTANKHDVSFGTNTFTSCDEGGGIIMYLYTKGDKTLVIGAMNSSSPKAVYIDLSTVEIN